MTVFAQAAPLAEQGRLPSAVPVLRPGATENGLARRLKAPACTARPQLVWQQPDRVDPIAQQGRQDPFALTPGTEAAKAVWHGIAEWQLAWPFTPVVAGDLDEFIHRWTG
jgi:hypothetical protein